MSGTVPLEVWKGGTGIHDLFAVGECTITIGGVMYDNAKIESMDADDDSKSDTHSRPTIIIEFDDTSYDLSSSIVDAYALFPPTKPISLPQWLPRAPPPSSSQATEPSSTWVIAAIAKKKTAREPNGETFLLRGSLPSVYTYLLESLAWMSDFDRNSTAEIKCKKGADLDIWGLDKGTAYLNGRALMCGGMQSALPPPKRRRK